MKKKILALAIAGSLAVPQAALAAEDSFGMQYTSASEGFYASIRAALYANGEKENGSANIGGAFSRFGVRGTNDLGGGLEGFYQYEAGIGIDNGRNPNSDGHSEAVTTRLGNVGLRGGFGEIVAGSIWHNAYNWTDSVTDIATVYSGYNRVSGGRKNRVIQYTSPDLNGFQVAILGQFDSSKDGQGKIGATAPRFRIFTQGELDTAEADDTGIANDAGTVLTEDTFTDAHGTGNSSTKTYGTGDDASVVIFIDSSNNGDLNPGEVVVDTININPKDDNDLDEWSIAAKYGIQGFSLGAAYYGQPDKLSKNAAGTSREDWNAWVLKAGYGQDNWSVGGWFSKDNASDAYDVADDEEKFGISGTVTVNKIGLYAYYENVENGSEDDATVGLGANYNLGSRTRVFLEYFGQDHDSASDEDDDIIIGLRHDF